MAEPDGQTNLVKDIKMRGGKIEEKYKKTGSGRIGMIGNFTVIVYP